MPVFNTRYINVLVPVLGEESSSDYNEKVNQALENYHFDDQSFFIVGKGRNNEEKSVVKIECGKYFGFGFIDAEIMNDNLDLWHDCIQKQRDNKEVRQIINSHIRKNKSVQVITFKK